MKNKIFSYILLAFISFSCHSQNSIQIDKNTDLEKINNKLLEHFKKIEILQNVQNISNLEVTSLDNDKLVIAGTGKTIIDEKITLNTTFRVLVVDNLLTSEAESCSGNNCEYCKFVKKGGCDCERVGSVSGGAAYCNHSTTKKFAEIIGE